VAAGMTAMRAGIPGDRARLVEVGDGRLACSECVSGARRGQSQFGADADADRLWQFQREECRDTTKADSFELRRQAGKLEYRVVGVGIDWTPTGSPEWQPYQWDHVLCFGSAYDAGIIRIFEPRTGMLMRVRRGC
jgi:hypothetical protein